MKNFTLTLHAFQILKLYLRTHQCWDQSLLKQDIQHKISWKIQLHLRTLHSLAIGGKLPTAKLIQLIYGLIQLPAPFGLSSKVKYLNLKAELLFGANVLWKTLFTHLLTLQSLVLVHLQNSNIIQALKIWYTQPKGGYPTGKLLTVNPKA